MKITSQNKILHLSRLNRDCNLTMSHVRCCLFDFKQILEQPGLPELSILVEVKIEKVVLPSYVKVSHVTATSFQLPKEVLVKY